MVVAVIIQAINKGEGFSYVVILIALGVLAIMGIRIESLAIVIAILVGSIILYSVYLIRSTSEENQDEPPKTKGIQSPELPAQPVESMTAHPSITIERTIYDPLIRDFAISSSRQLVNVRDWINCHDPFSYWLVICVHNHGNHPLDEWGIELESSSTLQILETVIEGSDEQVRLQVSNPKPWLQLSTFGVPHNRGIVIPRGGSRRVYIRLGSEACGVSHSIKGRFITSDAEVEIREKQYQHSCDVATLGVAIRQNPGIALKYTENALMQRYDHKTVLSYLHTFRLIQEIDTCCRTKQFEDVNFKLYVLEDALDKMGVSERLVGLVKQLNALDIDDGMGGSMLEIKAQRAEKMCKNIVDVWANEVIAHPVRVR
ncbi:MAG: hypothetical protein CVV31_07185 [Methanomicrobiales archaeon HGW-Methanomicrobiales-2]|nr:MAG: hypothetical protein CVV31_07185 [Methanomicrobiales archaeon HGW-Methanomicrobiales-2]